MDRHSRAVPVNHSVANLCIPHILFGNIAKSIFRADPRKLDLQRSMNTPSGRSRQTLDVPQAIESYVRVAFEGCPNFGSPPQSVGAVEERRSVPMLWALRVIDAWVIQ